ncbi:transporter suffix domain-containing protein [Parashewanella tropica]|uniref:transporter suffix domain-containing protein n=1 Tax=Parashewanella tropica TaxID=2547970 RepID=UPI001059653B|nr:transporter suffix domain-containing protein [Parashewanella tropica]
MKKVLGYSLLILSILAWCAIPILPFIDISKAQIAAFTTGLIVAGEVFFYSFASWERNNRKVQKLIQA